MARYNLVFWEPTVSPHKVPLFKALAALDAVNSVHQVSDTLLPPERAAMGWSVESDLSIMTTIAPSDDQVAEIVAEDRGRTVHLFSGLRWVPTIVKGLREVRKQRAQFGILSEPRVWDGPLGLARLAQSWLTEGWIRRHCHVVLGIGAHGPRWFRMAGYPVDRIFPFAYFLACHERHPQASLGAGGIPTLGYLGRLVESKGFGVFLDSLSLLKDRWSVVIAGTGNLEPKIASVIENLRNKHDITFRGVIPIQTVPQFLATVDLLAVPSLNRDDGWGGVVGEALFSGAAVAVSPLVGASVCVRSSAMGDVLPKATAEALAVSAGSIRRRSIFGMDDRAARSDWARSHISAEAGARYLVDVLDYLRTQGPRPRPFFES